MDGIAAKLLRCGIASEALQRNMPLTSCDLLSFMSPSAHVEFAERSVRVGHFC